MLLDYVSTHWAVQAILLLVLGVLLLAALTFRKIENSDVRQKQREREREMLIEHPKLMNKSINRD